MIASPSYGPTSPGCRRHRSSLPPLFSFSPRPENLLIPAPYVSTVDLEIDAEIPVVLLIFDELATSTLIDTDHDVDAVRFPAFASLAATSHWFRNATTNAEYTPMAVPAILTGRFTGPGPGPPTLPTPEKHPQNLFTLLAPEYQLNAFETLTSICPRELCGAHRFDTRPVERIRSLLGELPLVYLHSVLPADLTNELPDVSHQWRAFNRPWRVRLKKFEKVSGGRKPQIFADFIATMNGGEKRALYFLHSTLPHMPWRYLPSRKTYGSEEADLLFTNGLVHWETWTNNELFVLEAYQRYILQVQFVDRLLGDVLAALEENGLLDPALVIVTADHGVSFHPGGGRRPLRESNAQDVLPVPLFVKLPGQREAVVSDRNVELVDIVPTIADVLGLEGPPWPTDGASVLDPRMPERPGKRVILSPFDGSRFEELDVTGFDAMYDEVERRIRIFGDGSEPLDLYRIGPHAELVGRPLAELEVATTGWAALHLTLPDLYDAVDLGSDFLPARVVGEIREHGVERGSLDLAIALGGTVWAVTRTFSNHRDRARFAVMVPEIAFTPGRNEVEVYIVEAYSGDSGSDRLRLTPTRRFVTAEGFGP